MTPYEHAIPLVDLGTLREVVGDVPIDFTDPRSHEPLVNLRDTAIAHESYYARTDGHNPPFHLAVPGSSIDVYLRKTVVAMLMRVNERLHAHGCEVFVLTGYTSPACLRGLWELHLDHARTHAPDAGEPHWRAYAKSRVRDPELFDADDPRTWPAHTTGGAVDLRLRDLVSGRMLDMGSQFEELAPVSNSDYFERQLADGTIGADDIRLRNRRLLHWAMSAEGFVNEPPLYWHFDWGNQLYVKTLRATSGRAPATAWYGFGGPAPDEQGAS